MSLHLAPDTTFNGIPARDIIAFLNTIMADHGLQNFSMAGCMDPKTFDCLDACVDHGLIDAYPGEICYAISEAGDAMRHAKLRDRVTLAQAREVFRDFMARMTHIENEMPIRFYDVWLFGSFMREEDLIGDLDISILYEFTRHPSSDVVLNFIETHKAVGDFGYDPILRRLLGIDQQPLLDGVTFDSLDLRTISAPCRQVERSGDQWTLGPVLDRHPSALFESPMQRRVVRISCDQGLYDFKGRLEPTHQACINAPEF